ncbi:MAG: cation transporter [Candidatus Aenigmatarchaeota archaeon]
MESIIDIKGMHCKSCAELIETKLKALEGIERVSVSFAEEKAFIDFDPKLINFDKIKKEIESFGYRVDIKDELIKNNISNKKTEKKSILQGITYGLIPHTGCIVFILASVLGVTTAIELFKPLLLNPYFFYILMLLSFTFATISSAFYLMKNGLLSSIGIKRKWKYLSTMYGSTIGINLLLFIIIFPLLTNVSTAQSVTGNLIALENNLNSLSSLKLSVDIPCSGHAPLISDELKKLNGVSSVQFSLPNVFDVKYDPTKISKQQILSLDIFKTYKAIVLSEATNKVITTQQPLQNSITDGGSCRVGSCGCGCGER